MTRSTGPPRSIVALSAGSAPGGSAGTLCTPPEKPETMTKPGATTGASLTFCACVEDHVPTISHKSAQSRATRLLDTQCPRLCQNQYTKITTADRCSNPVTWGRTYTAINQPRRRMPSRTFRCRIVAPSFKLTQRIDLGRSLVGAVTIFERPLYGTSNIRSLVAAGLGFADVRDAVKGGKTLQPAVIPGPCQGSG